MGVALSLALVAGFVLTGMVALAVASGQSPQRAVTSTLNTLQGVFTASAPDEEVAEQIAALRSELSAYARATDARLSRLEDAGGLSVSQAADAVSSPAEAVTASVDEVGADLRAQQAFAPALPPPTTTLVDSRGFGGPVGVDEVVRAPLSAAPAFTSLEPAQPTVCASGCAHTELNQAYRAAQAGDTISIAPGYYRECLHIRKSIRIVGLRGPNGERAQFDRACRGKGAFVIGAPNVEIRGVQVQDISVRDRNGACFRLEVREPGSVRLFDIVCTDSENGILGFVEGGALFVDSSLFVRNGLDGRAHGIYALSGREFVLRNSVIHSTKGQGHTLKSGFERTLIEGSVLAGLDGENSRGIDFFGGGTLIVTDSVLQQGPGSDNHDMIAIAIEPNRRNDRAEQVTIFENNWLIYDDPGRCCRILTRGEALGPIQFSSNVLVGINGYGLDGVVLDRNIEFDARQDAGLGAYDGTLASLPTPRSWSEAVR